MNCHCNFKKVYTMITSILALFVFISNANAILIENFKDKDKSGKTIQLESGKDCKYYQVPTSISSSRQSFANGTGDVLAIWNDLPFDEEGDPAGYVKFDNGIGKFYTSDLNVGVYVQTSRTAGFDMTQDGSTAIVVNDITLDKNFGEVSFLISVADTNDALIKSTQCQIIPEYDEGVDKAFYLNDLRNEGTFNTGECSYTITGVTENASELKVDRLQVGYGCFSKSGGALKTVNFAKIRRLGFIFFNDEDAFGVKGSLGSIITNGACNTFPAINGVSKPDANGRCTGEESIAGNEDTELTKVALKNLAVDQYRLSKSVLKYAKVPSSSASLARSTASSVMAQATKNKKSYNSLVKEVAKIGTTKVTTAAKISSYAKAQYKTSASSIAILSNLYSKRVYHAKTSCTRIDSRNRNTCKKLQRNRRALIVKFKGNAKDIYNNTISAASVL